METFIFLFFCGPITLYERGLEIHSPDLTTLFGKTVMPLIRAGRATEAGNHFFITKKMINFPYE